MTEIKRYLHILVAGALVIAALYFAFQSAQAGGVEPGSAQDPLVTKSYVDNYLDGRVRRLQDQLDEINKKIADLETKFGSIEYRPDIVLVIGSRTARVGDSTRELLAAPYLTPGGTTMVPFRFIGEALGAAVNYDPAARTVGYTTASGSVILKIGSNQGTVNGETRTFPAPAVIVNDITMVPVRVISEGMGAGVHWDPAAATVTIKP